MTTQQNNSWDILWLAKSLTESWGGRIFIWLALLLLANQTFGDPFGKYMDREFEIQSQQQANTYNLQLRTIELMEEWFDDVKDDIRDIKDELEDFDDRINALENWHQ